MNSIEHSGIVGNARGRARIRHAQPSKSPNPLRAAAITSLLLVLGSLPVVLGSYGRSDDYSQLIAVQEEGPGQLIAWSMSFGRPVNFVVNATLLELVNSVEGLWVLRATAAIGMAAGTFILARAGASRDGVWSQVAVPALVFALPGTWVFIAWAQGAGHAAAFVCASASCYLALRATGAEGTRLMATAGAAAGLLVMAMFSYQTMGLAIPGLILACGLIAGRARDGLRTALIAVPVTVAVFASNVAVVRMNGSSAVESRAGVTTDWSGKADWVVRELAPRVIWPFSLAPRFLAAVLVVGAVIILLLVRFERARRTRRSGRFLAILLTGAAVVALPLAPLIVIAENWASSRAVFAPALVLWLLIVALVFDVSTRSTAEGAQARSTVLIAFTAVFVLGAFAGSYRAYLGLTRPAMDEWQEIRSLWSEAPSTVERASVQLQPPVMPYAPYVSYDEFGLSSGSIAWSAAALQAMAAREATGLDLTPAEIAVSEVPGSCESGPLVGVSHDGRTLRINPIQAWGCGLQD